MQIRTTELIPLLDEKGNLTQPGYATEDLFAYNKDNIKGARASLKEWEFYQISNRRWCLQLTYGHTSYAGSVSMNLIDFVEGVKYSVPFTRLFPGKRFNLDFNPNSPHEVSFAEEDFLLQFQVAEQWRHLSCISKGRVNCDIDLTMSNAGEAMCIATPFRSKKFYFNYKKNFQNLAGHVYVNGTDYKLDEETFALVDSGRGCWPYRHEWYWGSGTANVEGHVFGFNVGWGFGDTSQATENMLFVDGKAHKLDYLYAELDKKDYTKPWRFVSADKRFEMKFVPVYDNFTETNMVFMHNRCHQVFGRYYGSAVLDDGSKIQLDGMHGFCEHAVNRW